MIINAAAADSSGCVSHWLHGPKYALGQLAGVEYVIYIPFYSSCTYLNHFRWLRER